MTTSAPSYTTPRDTTALPRYWWLGIDWTNLLPSCLGRNRRRKQRAPDEVNNLSLLYKAIQSEKKDSFPIVGPRADREIQILR